MADDTDDPIEQCPSYPERGGFELKKALVLQQFNLKAAKFAVSLIGKPWDRDACKLALQDLATQVFELSKPTFKTLTPDVHIERDLGSAEVWEVVADGPRRPPRDSVRYQQNPELFHAEQSEIWRMLQDRAQCQMESLDQEHGQKPTEKLITESMALPRQETGVQGPVDQPEAESSELQRLVAERAERRRAVVMPILKKKRWKPGRLVTKAGVAKNSVYRYLDGTRKWISAENRDAIARELDLKPEDLPN